MSWCLVFFTTCFTRHWSAATESVPEAGTSTFVSELIILPDACAFANVVVVLDAWRAKTYSQSRQNSQKILTSLHTRVHIIIYRYIYIYINIYKYIYIDIYISIYIYIYLFIYFYISYILQLPQKRQTTAIKGKRQMRHRCCSSVLFGSCALCTRPSKCGGVLTQHSVLDISQIKGPDNPTRQLLPIMSTKCCSGDGEGRKDKGGGGGSRSKKNCVWQSCMMLYVKNGVWQRKMVCVTKLCVCTPLKQTVQFLSIVHV